MAVRRSFQPSAYILASCQFVCTSGYVVSTVGWLCHYRCWLLFGYKPRFTVFRRRPVALLVHRQIFFYHRRVICSSVIPARRCSSHNKNSCSAHSPRSPGSVQQQPRALLGRFSGPTGPTSPKGACDHAACSGNACSRAIDSEPQTLSPHPAICVALRLPPIALRRDACWRIPHQPKEAGTGHTPSTHRAVRAIATGFDTGEWPAPITADYTDELNDFDLRRLEALRTQA